MQKKLSLTERRVKEGVSGSGLLLLDSPEAKAISNDNICNLKAKRRVRFADLQNTTNESSDEFLNAQNQSKTGLGD